MQAGEPDREPAPEPSGSLAAWLATRLRAPASSRELAAAVALLIAAGPLATIAGAQLLARHERGDIARLRAEVQPRLAADLAAEQARSELSAALLRPALSSSLEAVARGLPADAALIRAERTARGALEIDVSTPDPDALRAALRRDPGLRRLRDTGQRQSDTMMIVSLREEAP